MSTTAIALPATSSSITRVLRIFVTEIRFEIVRALRNRTFSVATIGFPIMFYCLFGLMLNRGVTVNGAPLAKILLGSYAVFGGFGTALFGIGVAMAADLSAGWLELKRASPMPPVAYLLAKCCSAMCFSVIIATILCLIGITAGHVSLSFQEYLRMAALSVAGAIPFASMGLALALTVPFNSAPGIAQLLYLPMSFLGGLWVPLAILPKAVQNIAQVLPTYHMGQLMLGVFGYADPRHTSMQHWSGLLGYTCVMLGIAWIAFRRREQAS